jgi:serine/threonine protein kinase/tetratricopeptide (TPR) repeat protein
VSVDDSNSDRTRSFSVLSAGTRVSHYRIISSIGAGGMGEVYLAEDTTLDRRVALKFLPPPFSSDPESRLRFKREAQAAAALEHRNIVTIFDVGEFEDRPFFAMQYVDGQSLRDILKSRALDVREVINLAIGVCEGLAEAHRAGIIHRDIKPSNIVLDSQGRPKLLDFGLVSVRDVRGLTRSGAAVGTLGYVAPEVLHGQKAGARSDIFAVGVLMYELLTGQQPFRKETEAATINAVLNHRQPSVSRLRPEVPEPLDAIVSRAMAKDPDQRYPDVDALLAELRQVKDALYPPGTSGPDRLTGYSRLRPIHKIVIAALMVLPLVLLLVLSPMSRSAILGWFGWDQVPARRHLAVLPFTDLSASASEQAFCTGLSETLSSELTQMEQFQGSLWVVPASEVRQRGVSSARQARQTFGVNLVVSGSVQRFGDQLRMTLNLVDTDSERQIRAGVIDHSVHELTSLQDSSVVLLAGMLEFQFGPEEEKALLRGGTDRPEAYDLYLRGMGCLKSADRPANIDSAVSLFERALELDPEYALALAGLGEAYWRKYEIETDPKWEELAIYNSHRALELDDQAAPVYLTLGLIYESSGRYEQAADEYARALEVDSTNRHAHFGLARALESLGQADSAEVVLTGVIRVDPDYYEGYTRLGLFYSRRSRYAEARRQAELAVALDPQGYVAWNNIGGLFYALGDDDRARQMWRHSAEIEPNFGALSNLGTTYFIDGQYREAADSYERALKLNDRDYRLWMNLASALENCPGEEDRARRTYKTGIDLAEAQRQINPSDPELLASLADAYASVGNVERATALIEDAMKLAPDNPGTMVAAGIVYELDGRRDRALKVLGDVIKLGYPREQIETLPELKDLVKDPRFDSVTAEAPMPTADST